MKESRAFLAMTFAATVMLSLFIAPAAADFVHPDGIFIATYPQDVVMSHTQGVA